MTGVDMPPETPPRTLIDDLLAEQQTLITLLDKMRDQLKLIPKAQTATSPRKKASS